MNATPEAAKESKRAEVSRRKSLKDKGIENPEMPECNAAYLINFLFDLGPTQPAGMGEAAISEGEIESWQNNRRFRLTPWEATTLKRLSKEYAAQAQQATKADCPPPWAEAPYLQSIPNQVAESLRESMRALAEL